MLIEPDGIPRFKTSGDDQEGVRTAAASSQETSRSSRIARIDRPTVGQRVEVQRLETNEFTALRTEGSNIQGTPVVQLKKRRKGWARKGVEVEGEMGGRAENR